jgi:hypothetical protein
VEEMNPYVSQLAINLIPRYFMLETPDQLHQLAAEAFLQDCDDRRGLSG